MKPTDRIRAPLHLSPRSRGDQAWTQALSRGRAGQAIALQGARGRRSGQAIALAGQVIASQVSLGSSNTARVCVITARTPARVHCARTHTYQSTFDGGHQSSGIRGRG